MAKTESDVKKAAPVVKTAKIIVGYVTRAVHGFEELMPELSPNKTLKDEAKIKADLEAKKAAYMETARAQPYTGTFVEVCINDTIRRKILHYHEEEGKLPVSVRVCAYLLKTYPDAWGDTHDWKTPQAVFIGFEPRRFLKILGLECSLPSINRPCPPKMWYSNSDHRDIAEAVCPKDFKSLTLQTALRYRRPVSNEDGDQDKWDAILKGWQGPGFDAAKDVSLASVLAAQLGFIEPEEKEE